MDQQQSAPPAPPHDSTEPPQAQNHTEALPARGPWFQIRVPRNFEWNRYELPIAGLPPQLDGLRIAQITDLHLKKFWSEVYDQLIERVNLESPDLILMTGDFVDNKRNHLPAVPTVRKLVSLLRARLGIFGILGNHDRYAFPPRLEGCGITLLDGGRQVLELDGAAIELIGLPGVDRADLTPELLESFGRKQFGVPRLVLSHFPDHLRRVLNLRPDIFFAGHTHGGQICLPGGWPPFRHDSLPRRFCKGVHRAAATWLVVSRGLGFTNIPVRMFCPSEIVEIVLTRG